MLNVLLAGVGGQGTVLAAKVLASAAQSKRWAVRTAETIGMAQRGGSVVSHVRMASQGEELYASLVTPGTADLIVFEPGEAARALPYLSRSGTVVTARTTVQPVTAALAGAPYDGAAVIGALRSALADQAPAARLVAVDDAAVTTAVGTSRVLNMALLGAALATGGFPLALDDLRGAEPGRHRRGGPAGGGSGVECRELPRGPKETRRGPWDSPRANGRC